MADAILHDMQRITRLAAEPREPGDSTKAAIGRAARALGLSYRRARSFWYASPDVAVRAAEADKIRRDELRLIAQQRIQLRVRLEWIEARLNAREAAHNGALVGQESGAGLSLVSEAAGPVGRVAGEAGVIADPRQRSLLG